MMIFCFVLILSRVECSRIKVLRKYLHNEFPFSRKNVIIVEIRAYLLYNLTKSKK